MLQENEEALKTNKNKKNIKGIVNSERIKEISKVAEKMFQVEYQMKLKQATSFEKIKEIIEEYGAIKVVDGGGEEKFNKKKLKGLVDLVVEGGREHLEDVPENLYLRDSLGRCLDEKEKEKMSGE